MIKAAPSALHNGCRRTPPPWFCNRIEDMTGEWVSVTAMPPVEDQCCPAASQERRSVLRDEPGWLGSARDGFALGKRVQVASE
jgi:hypothetical protein